MTYSRQTNQEKNFDKFEKLFEEYLKECDTIKGAYEATEDYYKKNFGFRRYSHYDSFRNLRRHYWNKRKKRKKFPL